MLQPKGMDTKKQILKFIASIFIFLLIIGLLIDPSDDAHKESNQSHSEPKKELENIKKIEEKKPIIISVKKLYNDLDENALKASKTYKGTYVKITGKLSTIDSSGNYFSLEPLSGGFIFDSVHCNIEKKHIDTLINLKSGQRIIVTGKIKNVSEIFGYNLDVETIK